MCMTEKDMEAELAPHVAADVEQWLEEHPITLRPTIYRDGERIRSR